MTYAKSGTSWMKSVDHKFAPGKMSLWDKPSVMVRKGQQGGSGEVLTIEQQRAIDEHCMAEMHRLAPGFPYGEFANVTEGVRVAQSAAAAEAHPGASRG